MTNPMIIQTRLAAVAAYCRKDNMLVQLPNTAALRANPAVVNATHLLTGRRSKSIIRCRSRPNFEPVSDRMLPVAPRRAKEYGYWMWEAAKMHMAAKIVANAAQPTTRRAP